MSLILSGSDGLSDVDGSASTPAIRGTDANTGIFFPAADTTAISTGGSERVRVDSSGNVLVGTLTTRNKLTVAGTATATPTLGTAAGAALFSGTDLGYGTMFGTGNSGDGWIQQQRVDGTATAYNLLLQPSGGNVGIGTTSPNQLLDVRGSSSPTIKIRNTGAVVNNITQLLFEGTNTFNGTSTSYIQSISLNAGNSSTALVFGTNADGGGAAAERARITSGGEFYVAGTTDQGAYNIQCNGTGVWGAGAYVNGSDARIKEDVAPIDSGLDVVEKLNPVTYRYKEDWSKDQSVQTGFIAQELLTALDGKNYVDGIVQQGGSEGYYSVAYQNIIPILTKAIQELSAKNAALEARIAVLEAK